MSDYLCISVMLLHSRFHGRGDGGEPEWPPSPLRLLQAIVAANADNLGDGGDLNHALEWLENQEPPLIFAPQRTTGSPYVLSVPNNAMDIVGKAWSRGNYFGSGDANPATHRTMKTVRPTHLLDGDTLHYVWPLDEPASVAASVPDSLARAARRLVALGWGIDMAVGHAARLSVEEVQDLPGEMWKPTIPATPNVLRVPAPGTLGALRERYTAFLHRIGAAGFMPVEPLTRFSVVGYRRPTDPATRPWAVFELRRRDGSFSPYPQQKLVHIAGMVRHLARQNMDWSPPPGVGADWVERYVVGHQVGDDTRHRQFSYLPLPSISIRQRHADQLVRRVMVAAPVGDDALLEHLARRLAGQQLEPERGNEFGAEGPPTLTRVFATGIVHHYTRVARTWASVTPVILPGHDDRKPAKTRKLIEKALAQSGIEQPCEFKWNPYSHFPKSLSAHKYDKDKRPTGYIRPDHLLSQTAVHMKLRFHDTVSGPLAIGAGRHYGLGLFAAVE